MDRQNVPEELLIAGLIEANRPDHHHHVPAGPAITDHPADRVEWLRAILAAVLAAHEAMVRAKVAEELYERAMTHPLGSAFRRHLIAAHQIVNPPTPQQAAATLNAIYEAETRGGQ